MRQHSTAWGGRSAVPRSPSESWPRLLLPRTSGEVVVQGRRRRLDAVPADESAAAPKADEVAGAGAFHDGPSAGRRTVGEERVVAQDEAARAAAELADEALEADIG